MDYHIVDLSSGDPAHDDIGLLSAAAPPGVGFATAMEPPTHYRGRSSRKNSNAALPPSEEPYAVRDQYLGEAPTPVKVRRPSPGPASAVGDMLRRMTTRRTPFSTSRAWPSRRTPGSQYATVGEEGDADSFQVDISSLAGLGFELTDMSQSQTPKFENVDTEYVRPKGVGKPDFRSFVAQHGTLGDGMRDVGAKLTRNATRAPNRGGTVRGEASFSTAVSRNKTVRDIGQSLAREKNTIVMVNENDGIDLSSLEGHQITHRSSQNFDGMQGLGGPFQEDGKSFFFPKDPDIPNWKPFSMSKIYIIILTLSALALGAVQEYVLQLSRQKEKENSGILAFNAVAEVSILDFFAWKYMPTLVTIVYAVMYSIMDFDIRRLEPYHQLSQPNGSRASASLNLDHLTMFQYFVPFKAIRLRQWAVFFSTTANILASLAAPALQNPSVIFVENPDCNNDTNTCPNADEKANWVRISPVWSRLVSVSYYIVAIICVILFLQLRRKSGLLCDPHGIAGIAAMATKSHVLHEFKGLDQATRGEIHKKLQHRLFVLYKSSIWQGEWRPATEPIQESERRLRSPHPMMLRLVAGIPFLGFMCFGLLSIPLISLTPARVVPNAVPWLPVLLATFLKLFFNTFESDVRLIEPFYRLSLGNAKPEDSLTLDYQATVYGYMPFKAFFKGHYLVMMVGISSVLLDILTVTVSSFSVNSEIFLHTTDGQDTSNQDQTFVSFWVSFALSMIILIFVIATTVLVYIRRRHPFLPREPSTIAAILAFIYGSNMLTDFIDSERLTHRQMEDRLKKLGKRYALGWFKGRDGEIHCAIDEEPMRSKYVHGKPYTMAQAGPLAAHETFYSVV